MGVGMSARPEFYSARGATCTDLNSQILEKVYSEVQGNYGSEAGENFVQMVADIPKLSMTDFLNTLYELERHEWRWDKSLLGDGKGIDLGPDRGDGSREAVGFAIIGAALSGRVIDQTSTIRGDFLRSHGRETSSEERSYEGSSTFA